MQNTGVLEEMKVSSVEQFKSSKSFNRTRNARRLKEKIVFFLLRGAAFINVAVLLSLVFYIVWNGVSLLSWDFLTESPREMMTKGGLWPCIVGTFLLAFGAMVIALPFGVGCAI